MKFTFRRIKHSAFDLDYGYCLILNSLAELIAYDMQLKGHYETGFHDAITACGAMRAGQCSSPHATTDIGHLTVLVGLNQGKSLIDAFLEVTSRSFKTKMRALQQFGKVYIHNNLKSFFVPSDGVTEYGEIVYRDRVADIPSEELPEPRFVQWSGGQHYYVKCGVEDVVVDGQQKWDTLEEAQAAFAVWKENKS